MTEVITSASNSTVKQLRKLTKSSKERHAANLFIAEGVHLAQSYLASGRTPTMYFHAVSAEKNHEVAELIEELKETSAQSVIVADSLFETITDIHASSGICIVFKLPEVHLEAILPLKTTAILLEDIQDPGNLGTILRTAAAVGVKHVLLSSACASPWSPKALRAGMGAQFSLEVYEDVNLREVIETAEVPTAATILGGDSVSLYATDLRRDVAWLFGSEGPGISDELAAVTTIKVTIPQEMNAVESLNVAAAATVCLYEQYRQKIQ